jgi:hypothetical protein
MEVPVNPPFTPEGAMAPPAPPPIPLRPVGPGLSPLHTLQSPSLPLCDEDDDSESKLEYADPVPPWLPPCQELLDCNYHKGSCPKRIRIPLNHPGNIYGNCRDPMDILKNYYRENLIPPQTHKFPSGSRLWNRAPSVPDSLISQDKLEEEHECWFKGHKDNPLALPMEKEIKTEEEAAFAKFAEEGGVVFIDFLISM